MEYVKSCVMGLFANFVCNSEEGKILGLKKSSVKEMLNDDKRLTIDENKNINLVGKVNTRMEQLLSLLKEVREAINKYGEDHIDLMINEDVEEEKEVIGGIYHSRHNSFGVTEFYPRELMTNEELEELCDMLDIGFCE